MLILLAQFFVIEPFFLWQTNDPEIAAYGISYLRVCMIFSFGCMTQWVFDRFLIATGKVHLFTVSLVSASVTNLILDPIFIFGGLIQAIFLLPFLFLFSRMGNLTFIWSAFIVAEVLGLMLGLVLHKKYVLFSRDNMVQ